MTRHREVVFWLGLGGLFTITVTTCLVAAAVMATFVPGWNSSVVSSNSMSPRLRTGDIVVSESRSPADIGVGAVIVFADRGGNRIVHRVVANRPDGGLETRGDANAVSDTDPVMPERIEGVGRVVIPVIGHARIWWGQQQYLRLAVLTIAFMLAAWLSRLAWASEFDPWQARGRRFLDRAPLTGRGPLWLSGDHGANHSMSGEGLLPENLRLAIGEGTR